jgi:uncharacterized DUF497 family protein/predicted DNA binding CopG/RHH family protein
MSYQWDDYKAATNLEKHGIDFADAVSVFLDDLSITVCDERFDEERFVTIGLDAFGRVLVVVYTCRSQETRIISARKATRPELTQYKEGWSMDTEYDFSQGKRGAIDPLPAGKTRITIRLDDEVLEWFREQVHTAGGGNYQTLINNALCEHIQQHREPLETILRRVLREELERAGK